MYSKDLRSSILREIEKKLDDNKAFETTNQCFLFNKTKFDTDGNVIYRTRLDGSMKNKDNIPNCSFVKYKQTYNSPEYYAYYSGYAKDETEDSIWYTVCDFKDEYLESLAKYCSSDLENYDLYLKGENQYLLYSKKNLSFKIFDEMVNKYRNLQKLVFVLVEETEKYFKYSITIE